MTTHFSAEFAYHLHKQGFVSKEETRYYLQGVCVEKAQTRPGCYLVATDGHRLAVFYDEYASTDQSGVIVSLNKTGLAACKPGRNQPAGRRVVVTGSAVAVHDQGDEFGQHCDAPLAINCGDVIDGTFPDWRRVIPAAPKPEEISPAKGFNPAYLAAYNFKPFDGGDPVLLMEQGDAATPAVIRNLAFPTFFSVLMPVRGDEEIRPDWLDDSPRALPETQAAE